MSRILTAPPKAIALPDWDQLAIQYATSAFIAADPIAFPHAVANNEDWRDAECIAFLAALLSYGRREQIGKAMGRIAEILGPQPVEGLLRLAPEQRRRKLRGFYYRFNTAADIDFMLGRLAEIYTAPRKHQSLKQLWAKHYAQANQDLRLAITTFRTEFLHGGKTPAPLTYGLKFLMADPGQGSAAKRFNMFLRWMVRKDAVDLGLWADVMTPAALHFPLDTHVGSIARHYGITQRKTNDWKTVEEITQYFRQLGPEDPVRYDFALFGLGVNRKSSSVIDSTGLARPR